MELFHFSVVPGLNLRMSLLSLLSAGNHRLLFLSFRNRIRLFSLYCLPPIHQVTIVTAACHHRDKRDVNTYYAATE